MMMSLRVDDDGVEKMAPACPLRWMGKYKGLANVQDTSICTVSIGFYVKLGR